MRTKRFVLPVGDGVLEQADAVALVAFAQAVVAHAVVAVGVLYVGHNAEHHCGFLHFAMLQFRHFVQLVSYD